MNALSRTSGSLSGGPPRSRDLRACCSRLFHWNVCSCAFVTSSDSAPSRVISTSERSSAQLRLGIFQIGAQALQPLVEPRRCFPRGLHAQLEHGVDIGFGERVGHLRRKAGIRGRETCLQHVALRGLHLELPQQAFDLTILDRPAASRIFLGCSRHRRALRELEILHDLAGDFPAREDVDLGLHVTEPFLRKNERTQHAAQRLLILGVHQQRHGRLVRFWKQQARQRRGEDRGQKHEGECRKAPTQGKQELFEGHREPNPMGLTASGTPIRKGVPPRKSRRRAALDRSGSLRACGSRRRRLAD